MAVGLALLTPEINGPFINNTEYIITAARDVEDRWPPGRDSCEIKSEAQAAEPVTVAISVRRRDPLAPQAERHEPHLASGVGTTDPRDPGTRTRLVARPAQRGGASQLQEREATGRELSAHISSRFSPAQKVLASS